jgi:hypothetical protein
VSLYTAAERARRTSGEKKRGVWSIEREREKKQKKSAREKLSTC